MVLPVRLPVRDGRREHPPGGVRVAPARHVPGLLDRPSEGARRGVLVGALPDLLQDDPGPLPVRRVVVGHRAQHEGVVRAAFAQVVAHLQGQHLVRVEGIVHARVDRNPAVAVEQCPELCRQQAGPRSAEPRRFVEDGERLVQLPLQTGQSRLLHLGVEVPRHPVPEAGIGAAQAVELQVHVLHERAERLVPAGGLTAPPVIHVHRPLAVRAHVAGVDQHVRHVRRERQLKRPAPHAGQEDLVIGRVVAQVLLVHRLEVVRIPVRTDVLRPCQQVDETARVTPAVRGPEEGAQRRGQRHLDPESPDPVLQSCCPCRIGRGESQPALPHHVLVQFPELLRLPGSQRFQPFLAPPLEQRPPLDVPHARQHGTHH